MKQLSNRILAMSMSFFMVLGQVSPNLTVYAEGEDTETETEQQIDSVSETEDGTSDGYDSAGEEGEQGIDSIIETYNVTDEDGESDPVEEEEAAQEVDENNDDAESPDSTDGTAESDDASQEDLPTTAAVTYEILNYEAFGLETGSTSTEVTVGTEYTLVSAEEISGYTFNGWYYDAELTEACDASFTVQEDITVYGTYTVNEITIVSAENENISVTLNTAALPEGVDENNVLLKVESVDETIISENPLPNNASGEAVTYHEIYLVEVSGETETVIPLNDGETATVTIQLGSTEPKGEYTVYRGDTTVNEDETTSFAWNTLENVDVEETTTKDENNIEHTTYALVFETDHFTPFAEVETVNMSYSVVWEGQSVGSENELAVRPDTLSITLQSRVVGQDDSYWSDEETYTINVSDLDESGLVSTDANNVTTWGPIVLEDLPLYDSEGNRLEYRVVQDDYIAEYNTTSQNTDVSTYDEETNTFNQVVRNTYMEGWNYKIDLVWANQTGDAQYHKYYEAYNNTEVNTLALVSISTQKTYDVGQLTFSIPLYLFANTANEDKTYASGRMSAVGLGDSSNPTTTESFTYYIDNKGTSDPLDDEIVFYNYQAIASGINFSTTINYHWYMATIEDYTTGILQVNATGQYIGQAQPESQTSNTIDYTVDTGHSLSGTKGIRSEILYANTYASRLGSAYAAEEEDWDFENYVYVLYTTSPYSNSDSGLTVYYNQDFNTVLTVTPGNDGEVVAAKKMGSVTSGTTHYDVTYDEETGTYVYTNSVTSSRTTSSTSTDNVVHSFVVKYPKSALCEENTFSVSYTIDTISANVHEGDKEGYLEGTTTIDSSLAVTEVDNYEYGHAEDATEVVYSDYQYINTTGVYDYYKYNSKYASAGSLTKLEGGLDAVDSFYLRFAVNGYYTGSATTAVSEDGCTYRTVAYPGGRFPNGYRMTLIDDVLEVYARDTSGRRISDYYHLTEDDYELNATTAPYVTYYWTTGLDFSTGQGSTSNTRTEEAFELWAKTETDGEWQFVQYGYDTNQNGRVDFPDAVGKGYVAYKVVSPDLDGYTSMYLYNIEVTYKADSELLQSMAQKSDMSLDDYIHTLYISNIGAFRLDEIVYDEDGEKTYVHRNPYTGNGTDEIHSPSRLNVEAYVAEEDKNLIRYVRNDTLTRATGSAASSKFMRYQVDPSSKTVNLMNRLYVYQRYDGVTGEYGEDVDDKNELREVVFYDLLPEGYSYNREKPVYVYTNTTSNNLYSYTYTAYTENKVMGTTIPSNSDAIEAEVTDVEIIEDYQGSGRQMVIFHVKAPDDASTWKNYGTSYHYSMFSLTFYATGAYGDVNNGTATYNVMSVQKEDGTNFLSGGQASNRTITNDSTLYNGDGGRVDYTDVNKEGNANTLYSATYVTPVYLSSYEAGIKKNVKGYSGMWSLQDQVLLDNDYRYRIQYGTTSGTTKNLIIYDILETAINSDGATGELGMWQGTYVSSNVKSLTAKGIDVKIWYSVQSGLKYDDFDDTEYLPEDYPTVWTDVEPEDKTTIKAVAYDLRYKLDGTEFVLEPYNTLSLEIVMHAPDDLQDYQWAYNLVAYNSTFIDTAGNVMSSFNQSNRVKIELNKYCELSLEKYYYQGDSTVRVPLANTEFSLYKCSSTEEDHEHTGKPGDSDSCWTYFQKIMTDSDGNATFTRLLNGEYAVVESGTAAGFSSPNAYWTFTVDSSMGTVTDPETNKLIENSASVINMERQDDGTYAILNERETTKMQVNKVWNAPSEDIPESLVVSLYQDGEKIDEHALTAEEDWSYTFDNLYKYSLTDGHEYVYTVEETVSDDFVSETDVSNLTAEGNVKLTFNEDSKSYNSSDVLYIYYKPEGSNTFVRVSRSGTNTWAPVVLPAVDDYYFYWFSNNSYTAWGFEIDSVELTDDEITAASSTSITSAANINSSIDITEVTDISEIKTDHNYTNNERTLWHISGLGGSGQLYTFTNTRLEQLDIHKDVPYITDATNFNFAVTFTVEDTVDGEVTTVPVTQDLIVHKYASRDAETYETITLTPDENGTVTFTLSDEEWVRFVNLPLGTSYHIEEEDTAEYSESINVEDENGDVLPADRGVYLKLNSNSATESTNYDYFTIYYQVDEQWYAVKNTLSTSNATRFGGTGNTMGVNHTDGIYVPTTDFYIAWRSDGSSVRWGFEFDSVTIADGPSNLATYAAANDTKVSGIETNYFGTPEVVETSDPVADVKTAHSYSNNERNLWHVTLVASGDNEIDGQTSSDTITSIRVTNTKYTDFSFTKVNYTGETRTVLSDVEFALYKCTNTGEHEHIAPTEAGTCYKLVTTVTSDENGNVTFGELLDGQYALKETSAPMGLVVPSGYWTFDVTSGVVGTVSAVQAESGASTPSFTETTSGYELNNSREMTQIRAVKNWDSAETDIPESLVVSLYQDGVKIDEHTLTADEDWTYTFANLYRYDLSDGHEYVYTVTEDVPEGFTSEISDAVNIKAEGNVKLTFNSNSKTYNSSDALYIYYKPVGSNTFVRVTRSGTGTWDPVVLPAVDDYYFYWYSNNSGIAWGFEINSLEVTDEAVTAVTNTSITNAANINSSIEITEANYISEIKTAHDYSNDERILWHVSTLGGVGKEYTLTNTRLGYFDVHKHVENSDTTDSFAFTAALLNEDGTPYTETVTYHKYASEDAEEYTTLTAEPDENGTVTFSLSDGEWVRVVNLPLGVTYTVSENPGDPYNVIVTEDGNADLSSLVSQGVYLKLNSSSRTESTSYDYFAIYYQVDDQWYVVYNTMSGAAKSISTQNAWRFGGSGNTMGVNHTDGIYVPTTDFYVAWRSDVSQVFWGFEFDEVTMTNAPTDLAAYAAENDIAVSGINTSLFGALSTAVETGDIAGEVKTNHSYSNNEKRIWHIDLNANNTSGEYTDTTTSTDTTSVHFTNVDIHSSFSIPVEKVIDGTLVSGAERDFVFTLTPDEESNPMPTNASCTVTGSQLLDEDTPNTCSIGDITYVTEGVYGYTISESSVEGVNYDNYTFAAARHITVTAVIGTEGKLVITWVDDTDESENGNITFENSYTPSSVSIPLAVHKNIHTIGTDTYPTLKYKYDLTGIATDGEMPPMPSDGSTTVEITGAGTAVFGNITYTEVGTYHYLIQEEETAEKISSVEGYPDSAWSFDTGAHYVTVTVTDNAGQLAVSYAYDEGAAISYSETTTESNPLNITNIYDPVDVLVNFGISKDFEDNGQVRPEGKTFRFRLTAEDENTPMPVGSEDGQKVVEMSLLDAGETVFGTIIYTENGTYNYTVQEVAGSDTGYTYDSTVYNIEVVVTDTAGQHQATVKVNGTEISAGTSSDENNTVGSVHIYDVADFTNIYEPNAANVTIPVEKVIEGAERPSDYLKDFTFVITGSDEVSTSMITSGSTTITDEGTGSLGLSFTKAGTYSYTVRETAESETGYTYDTNVYGVTVVVTDHDGQLSAVVTKTRNNDAYTSDSLVFENEYRPSSASAAVSVDKTITGHAIPDSSKGQQFLFTLTASSNTPSAPLPANTTVTITDDGEASFDEIVFVDAGVYEYNIQETEGSATGYGYDTTVKHVVITVTDNDGVLEAFTSIDDVTTTTAEAENTYVPVETELEIPVTKLFSEDSQVRPEEQTFTFTIVGSNEEAESMIPEGGNEVTITGEGSASFNLNLTKAGTYNYTITEVKPDDVPTGYTYDTTSYRVKVTVTDNGGELAAEYEIHTGLFSSPDAIVFENEYVPTPVSLELPIEKDITSAKLSEDDTIPSHTFEFVIEAVTENAPMPSKTTVSVSEFEDGIAQAVFDSITFDHAGTYSYTIRENSSLEDYENWGMDEKAYIVTVTVSDKNGVLEATYEITDSLDTTVVLTNVYNPVDATLSIPVSKEMTGNDRPSDYLKDFEFTLEGVDGAPMPEDAVDGIAAVKIRDHGETAFGVITYEKTGKYYYTIREVNTNETGYTYDEAIYTVEVTVVHDGNDDETQQSLSASITEISKYPETVEDEVYEDEEESEDVTDETEDDAAEEEEEEQTIVFTNAYAPNPVSVTLPVTKNVTGAVTPSDKTFTFTLTGNDQFSIQSLPLFGLTSTITGSDTNDEAFTMTYTAAGTYTYTVKETEGSEEGYTYDSSEYIVEVVVTDEDGVLTAETSILKDSVFEEEIVFENEYLPTPTDLVLNVQKNIEGDTPSSDAQFRFTITPRDNEPMPSNGNVVLVSGAGTGSFGEIHYDTSGHYYYAIAEINDNVTNYTYDTNTYMIHVQVVDNNGALETTWEIVESWPEEDEDIVSATTEDLVFTNTYTSQKTEVTPTPTPTPSSGGGQSSTPETTQTRDRIIPNTSDDFNLNVWMSTLIISILAMITSVFVLRKN